MHDKKETLTLAWCDNGTADGKFAESVACAVLAGTQPGNVAIHSIIRVQGNQIARQRQGLFEIWANQDTTDWILWVDSDIVLNNDALKKLWYTADKDTAPVVSGVYFVSRESESTMMMPLPCVYKWIEDNNMMECIHPLPYEQVIDIDAAGMGFVLMHRSIIQKLEDKFPDGFFFAETSERKDKFISEDISFFKKLTEVGVKVVAHTGAVVQHMKRFSYDSNFYNTYWNSISMMQKEQEERTAAIADVGPPEDK